MVRWSELSPLMGRQEMRWRAVNTRRGCDKACFLSVPPGTEIMDKLSQGMLSSGSKSGGVSVRPSRPLLCSLPLTSGVSSSSLLGHGGEANLGTGCPHASPLHCRPEAVGKYFHHFLGFPNKVCHLRNRQGLQLLVGSKPSRFEVVV